MNLEQIEKKYNIAYPKLYKILDKVEMLSWGEFGSNWFKNEFPKQVIKPPLLLFGNDFELLDNEMIANEIEAFKDPEDYRQTDPKYNFIPFAQNGAGDLYCFQFDKKDGNNIPVVLVWHDSNLVQVLAKNLQDFMFRSMLETIIDFEEESSLLKEGGLFKNLKNYQKTHLEFLSTNQQEIIIEAYTKIISDQRNNDAILNDSEIKQLIDIMKTEIFFDDLDSEFTYQIE